MAGVDYPDTYWALSNKTPGRDNAQYVAFHRDTKLTCIGCYQHVIDGRQHYKKTSACAYGLAVSHLLYCVETNHYDDTFKPNPHLIAMMLHDERVPLGPRDIMLQEASWDPTTKFKIKTQFGHTVCPDLKDQSFETLYKAYVAQDDIKEVVTSLAGPPNHEHTALARANDIRRYIITKNRIFEKHVDKCVQTKLNAAISEQLGEKVEQEINKRLNTGELISKADYDKEIQEGRLFTVNMLQALIQKGQLKVTEGGIIVDK